MSNPSTKDIDSLQKRIKSHSTTIGIWAASTVAQDETETLRRFKERLIALGAHLAMAKANLPLLKEVVGQLDE